MAGDDMHGSGDVIDAVVDHVAVNPHFGRMALDLVRTHFGRRSVMKANVFGPSTDLDRGKPQRRPASLKRRVGRGNPGASCSDYRQDAEQNPDVRQPSHNNRE